jgi:hypothetical protein
MRASTPRRRRSFPRKHPEVEPQFHHLAAELAEWFDSVFALTQKSLFGIVPDGPHRDAVVVDSMIRNARIIYRAELDTEGKLYSPLCFFLVAACRHLGARLGTSHWRAALENLRQSHESLHHSHYTGFRDGPRFQCAARHESTADSGKHNRIKERTKLFVIRSINENGGCSIERERTVTEMLASVPCGWQFP